MGVDITQTTLNSKEGGPRMNILDQAAFVELTKVQIIAIRNWLRTRKFREGHNRHSQFIAISPCEEYLNASGVSSSLIAEGYAKCAEGEKDNNDCLRFPCYIELNCISSYAYPFPWECSLCTKLFPARSSSCPCHEFGEVEVINALKEVLE